MIISVQPRIFQTPRLRLVQHAKRATNLESELFHFAHELKHVIEFRTVFDFAPSRAHTKTSRAVFFRLGRSFAYFLDGKKFVPLNPRLKVRALRTVSTILRASARFDR